MAEPAFDLARTHIMTLMGENLPAINAVYRDLTAQGTRQLEACRVDGDFRFTRSADMRFVGQGYELNVPLPSGDYGAEDLPTLRDAFFAVYAATYGDRGFDRNDAVEVVHWRLTAACDMPTLSAAAIERGDGDARRALKGHRPAYFPETGGYTDCPVYDRYALRAGDGLDGPVIIEERESTVVIPPASRAAVDEHGNIVVDLESED